MVIPAISPDGNGELLRVLTPVDNVADGGVVVTLPLSPPPASGSWPVQAQARIAARDGDPVNDWDLVRGNLLLLTRVSEEGDAESPGDSGDSCTPSPWGDCTAGPFIPKLPLRSLSFFPFLI